MSNTYPLTAKIHELLPQVKAKYGLKFEVDSDYWYILPKNNPKNEWQLIHKEDVNPNDYTDFIPEIQEPQLRQILVGLQEVLENLKDPLSQKFGPKMQEKLIAYIHDPEYPLSDSQREVCIAYLKSSNYEPPTAKALCQKWLDGLSPLFDRDPEKVLQELVEILENLLK